MELRNLSHVYFIGAIKRGMVEKIINVDSHGRRALRFKTIEAIYESEDAKNLGSCTTFQQQEGRLMGSPFGCGGVKIDRPVLLMGGRKIKINPGLCHLDKDACDDMDDLSFNEMTLKQLKERCKTKKRKLPKSVDLKKGPCSHLSEDYAKLQLKEDDSDLEENLSSWKLKLSKKLKAKRKCIRKEVHSPCKSADSVSVYEQIPSTPQNSPQSTVDLTGPIKAEIEISGPEFSECPNLDGFTFGATLNSHSTVDISANVSDEVAGLCKRSELAIGESTFLTTEGPSCVVTEVSIERLDHDNSLSLPASAAVGEVMEDSFSEVTGKETLSFPISELDTNVSIIQSTPDISPMEVPLITNEPDSETCGSCESYSFMQGTSCEIDSSCVIHMPHKLNDDGFSCTKPNYDGGYISNVEMGDSSMEDTVPDPETIRNSDILYMSFQKSYQGLNSPSDFSSISCSSPTIEDKQKNSSLSVKGLMSTSMETESDGGIKEDNLPDPETSVMNSTDILYISSQSCHTCLNPRSSSEDFNSATDEKHSFPTEEESMSNIAGVRDCSVSSDQSEITASCTAMEVIENFCDLKLECPPKRLLSNRKAISPTSQEKLRQAVDAGCLNENIGLSKCREKLCFGKQSKIRASLTASDLKEVEVNVIPQRIILKLKNEKSRPNLLLPKGILKSPNVSCAMPHAAAESTSANPFAESAMAFSQRQMRDIECLATKLVKELKCMKDIVEENLHSEVYPSKSLKYTVDEMRVAVDKAGEVEETTRKWLSMMARDCSRFCRIMRSTGNKGAAAPTSSCGVYKDRKKIVFADEAGRPLCHVKVFEDQVASLCGSD
ncbi:uncharacterized protein LOC122662674 [Telopea speciosissima]|uniref:uncharacterized protein LOC122662674 n=1 Tax=Telopea speciosissima TaxID=54955 RepID=UPI001CC423AA|nr:uncharacterized protein LOC122662674 [Telopea speciosissima]